MAGNLTYKSKADAAGDHASLAEMRTALHAAGSAMRMDECRRWIIRGSRGEVSTWGDGRTWMLTVSPGTTALKWTWVKRRLAAFAELADVTQDGDDEGVFRLLRLPVPAEATEIRRIAGIRQPSAAIGERFSPAKTGSFGSSIAQTLAGLPDPDLLEALQAGTVVAWLAGSAP
jgi:hypothetical protein